MDVSPEEVFFVFYLSILSQQARYGNLSVLFEAELSATRTVGLKLPSLSVRESGSTYMYSSTQFS
ncbi:hypothetical protein KDW_61400 [Dictyobacter vulcani]|uniref:Uncharacterized protein n=1 Tax=Dictyobacter vulcani TaxID=2607529 RepID=A0A5J4KQK4_9CHLR|nr:hypothetical protein KDW_61400 [Dictyobacter vulcani]